MGLTLKFFYTNCVSYSRACRIEGGAKEWNAIINWRYAKDGYQYLANKVGDTQVTVFVDPDATNNHEDFSGFSFKDSQSKVMSYKSEFLPQMTSHAVGMTMRYGGKELEDKLKSDIIYPAYYHEYGEFDRLEVTQGQFFADRAHYEKTD